MENKIIVNTKIAEGFQELVQNNYIIKQALVPTKTKHGRYNRVIIKAVFSILKAMDDLCFKSNPHLYEEHIERILFLISKKYQLYYVKSAVDEKLGIDLNSCIERNDIIIDIVCEKFTKSIEFYKLIQDEIVNFYNKENKQCKEAPASKSNENTQKPFPGPEYFKPMFTPQQIAEQQMRPAYAYNPYVNQSYQPQIQPIHYKDMTFYANDPYAGGHFQSPFNKEQMQAINEICTEIPMFQPDGTPMNEAAKNLINIIDRKIIAYRKTETRNRSKAK